MTPSLRSRLILSLSATLVWAALLVSCGDDSGGSQKGAERLRVVTTTVQITALTKEVGGDAIALHGLISSGADPHEFEPTASDLVAIEEADLILRHGMGLDDWLDDTLQAGERAKLVTVTDGIVGVDTDGKRDPHVWLDPDNAKIMVDDIAAALRGEDPENGAMYDTNAAAYKQKLDQTKTEVQSIIDEIPLDRRKMVTDHDAFGYFAKAFGLEIAGAVFPVLSTQSEPSAQETAALLDTIEREGVKAVFAEASVNSRLASTLADDAGVAIIDDLYGDSLGEPGTGADTLDGMLLANARKIADALK